MEPLAYHVEMSEKDVTIVQTRFLAMFAIVVIRDLKIYALLAFRHITQPALKTVLPVLPLIIVLIV